MRLELGGARTLVRFEVGPVRGHAVVDRHAARQEAARLGVVLAVHEAHQLAHHVAMEPGRSKSIFRDRPARGENDEVAVGDAGLAGGRGEHSEDRRIRMVKAHRVDRHEARELVLVGHVSAVPGDNIER